MIDRHAVKNPLKLEIKAATGTLTGDEQEWHKRWKGLPVVVVRTPEDALRAIGALD
jgi:hypothetical protein